jgi:hypothetical protein
MSTITSRTTAGVVAGALLILAVGASPIGDSAPGFFLLILIAPPVSGLVAAARGRAWTPVAATWALSGLLMLVTDWVVNGEDQLFHLVLAAWMAGLVALGAAAGRRLRRPVPAMRTSART